MIFSIVFEIISVSKTIKSQPIDILFIFLSYLIPASTDYSITAGTCCSHRQDTKNENDSLKSKNVCIKRQQKYILTLILVDIRYCYIKFIFVHPTLACTDLAAGGSSYSFLQEEQVDLAIFEQVSAESKHHIYHTIIRIRLKYQDPYKFFISLS